ADQADSLLDDFGLRDEYRVVVSGDKAYLVRKDIASEDIDLIMSNEGIIPIHVADQVDAYLDARAFNKDIKRGDKKIDGVKVAAIRFTSPFDETKTKEWLTKNEIDFTDIQVGKDQIVAVRDDKAMSEKKSLQTVR